MKSRRIASLLMLSSAKIEEVSLTCCVLDVVKFSKLRKSRRIASFASLKIDRQRERERERERERDR